MLDLWLPRLDSWIQHATLLLLLKRECHRFVDWLLFALGLKSFPINQCLTTSAPTILKHALPALLCATLITPALGAEIDEAKLPPPAAIQIDFAHDIKPILEVSC